MARKHLQEIAVVSYVAAVWYFLYCIPLSTSQWSLDMNATRRHIEKKLECSLKLDKGSGCVLPRVDPFSSEATKFDKTLPRIKCDAKSWVDCYHSHCKINKEIQDTVKNIVCEYRDILYLSDAHYTIGPPVPILQHESYELINSDHVKVFCTGITLDRSKVEWSGNMVGFRRLEPQESPPGRENTYNVLIFGFDSTARNGFIRRMPKSWKVLTEELDATVMEGYNIVGEATPAAIIPILTGKRELELPDARTSNKKTSVNVDSFPFIFYKLKKIGYRTAYFEDSPSTGTFNYRLNGWRNQPTDHYLRPFLMEELDLANKTYCVGDIPQYKLMMDLTAQFMELDGKRFVFTFISDITHDDFNMIQTADEDFAAFLSYFKLNNEDTLLVVMSDSGFRTRKDKPRHIMLQGKFEERQPLMALRLPAALVRARPAALAALQRNARALTTPHDLHATLLDVLGMTQHRNPYRVPGADLPRALSMLEPIPRNRSCSEAGIEPQWCACVTWQNVLTIDRMYNKTALALVNYINELVSSVASLCVFRTLLSIEWVQRQTPNGDLLSYFKKKDADGWTSRYSSQTKIAEEIYQIKITVGPGRDEFQALMTYVVKQRRFLIKTHDILRTNTYNDEPGSVPLNSFCYSRQ